MSADRQYELVYIVPPETGDPELADLHAQIEGVVTRLGGTLEKTENWGRRKLAYEIGGHKDGIYVLEQLTASGELVKELDRRLRVADLVLRHLVIRVDEETRVVARTRSRRKAQTARRRAARGLPVESEASETLEGPPADERHETAGEHQGREG